MIFIISLINHIIRYNYEFIYNELMLEQSFITLIISFLFFLMSHRHRQTHHPYHCEH